MAIIEERERLLTLERAVHQSTDGIAILDADWTVALVNPAWLEMHRVPPEVRSTLVGQHLLRVHHHAQADSSVARFMGELDRAGRHQEEVLHPRFDGTHFPAWITGSRIVDTDGTLRGFVTIVRDLSGIRKEQQERIRIHALLAQARRTTAIGRLAGGIAHDFNNLMTIVIGYSDFLLGTLPESDPLRDHLEPISRAGKKAAALTQQLLGFGRRKKPQHGAFDLNVIVAEMQTLLARLLGEQVRMRTELQPDLMPVSGEREQLEQVVLNLVINARDALPHGGTISLRSRNVPLEDLPPACALLRTDGRAAVVLSVQDDGIGMSPEVAASAFDPFFTTKVPAKGTGLGLALVRGIVEQHGGCIRLETTPGDGSTFHVYLPSAAEAASSADGDIPAHSRRRPPMEHVLLVEADEDVRDFAAMVLRRVGHSVTEAASGQEALVRFIGSGDALSVVIVDLVLPDIDGADLVEQLLLRKPSLRVVVMSGHDPEEQPSRAAAERYLVLPKPYTGVQLLDALSATVGHAA